MDIMETMRRQGREIKRLRREVESYERTIGQYDLEIEQLRREIWSLLPDAKPRPKPDKEQLAIMEHTDTVAAQGRYCGDSAEMEGLIQMGLMERAGTKPFVPDPYFRLTDKGREFLDAKKRQPEGLTTAG